MEAVFVQVVNLSIAASWLVLVVMVLRVVFRRAPKWIFCLLWGLMALRLVCPFSIESALSLIPSAHTLPPEIIYTATPQIDSGIELIDRAVNPILAHTMTPQGLTSANPTQIWSFLLSRAWVLGIAVMALYALISCLLLKSRVGTATLLRENIWQSEGVDTPFVLGLFRPVIYLPYRIGAKDLEYVIAHEQAHIRRRDHWWKPLGFALLSVYWFHPLLWAAYVLLCRDIEGACDETVIRGMEKEGRQGYSTALLHCSIRRRSLAACPLAFGEVGVKERVKAVMGYKKPTFWIIAAALAACAMAAVCFLTDPHPYSAEIQVDGRIYVQQEGTVAALPDGSYELGILVGILHDTQSHPEKDFSGVNLDEKYAGNPLYQSGTEEDTIYLEDFGGYFLPFQTQWEGGAVPTPAPSAPLSPQVEGTVFTYGGQSYDLSERNASINAVTDWFPVGQYLVFQGHTGPKHNVYCIFDTVSRSFEPDLMGANLTFRGDDITTGIYSFWSDVYAYDGTLLASFDLEEEEFISRLEYSRDPTQITAHIFGNRGEWSTTWSPSGA